MWVGCWKFNKHCSTNAALSRYVTMWLFSVKSIKKPLAIRLNSDPKKFKKWIWKVFPKLNWILIEYNERRLSCVLLKQLHYFLNKTLQFLFVVLQGGLVKNMHLCFKFLNWSKLNFVWVNVTLNFTITKKITEVNPESCS